MKIDMHCHVKEGSLDSRVTLEEYVQTCKEKVIQKCHKSNCNGKYSLSVIIYVFLHSYQHKRKE